MTHIAIIFCLSAWISYSLISLVILSNRDFSRWILPKKWFGTKKSRILLLLFAFSPLTIFYWIGSSIYSTYCLVRNWIHTGDSGTPPPLPKENIVEQKSSETYNLPPEEDFEEDARVGAVTGQWMGVD